MGGRVQVQARARLVGLAIGPAWTGTERAGAPRRRAAGRACPYCTAPACSMGRTMMAGTVLHHYCWLGRGRKVGKGARSSPCFAARCGSTASWELPASRCQVNARGPGSARLILLLLHATRRGPFPSIPLSLWAQGCTCTHLAPLASLTLSSTWALGT